MAGRFKIAALVLLALVLLGFVVPYGVDDGIASATTETADYRAEVRGVSWFGIPRPIIEVSCGGLQWRRR